MIDTLARPLALPTFGRAGTTHDLTAQSSTAHAYTRARVTEMLSAAQLPLVTLGALFMYLVSQPLFGDVFWMLSYARVIVTTGQLPTSDPLTFAPHTDFFFDAQWLAQLIYSLPMSLLGLQGVMVFNALTCTVAFAFVMHLTWKRSHSVRAAALCTSLFVIAAQAVISPRAQTLAYVPFAITYWLLMRGTLGMGGLLALAVLEAAWVNIHGSFFLGPVLTGLVLLGTVAQRLRWPVDIRQLIELARHTLRDHRVRWLVAAGVVQTAATLLNPYGIAIYDYAIKVSVHPVVRQGVTEWQPTRIDDAWGPMIYFTVALTIALIARGRGWKATDIALAAFFALMAILARRNMGWWMLVGPPIVASYLVELRVPWIGSVRSNIRTKIRGKFVAAALAIGLLVSMPWVRQTNGAPLVDPIYPVRAVDFLLSQPPTSQSHGDRMLALQFWSAYLDYRLLPRYQLMVDTSIEVHSREVWQDYFAINDGLAGWEELADKYDLDTMLLSKEHNQALIASIQRSPRWALAYTDELAAVYVRAEDPAEATAPAPPGTA